MTLKKEIQCCFSDVFTKKRQRQEMRSRILLSFVFGFVYQNIPLSLFRSRGQGFSFSNGNFIARFYVFVLSGYRGFLSGLENLFAHIHHLLFCRFKNSIASASTFSIQKKYNTRYRGVVCVSQYLETLPKR